MEPQEVQILMSLKKKRLKRGTTGMRPCRLNLFAALQRCTLELKLTTVWSGKGAFGLICQQAPTSLNRDYVIMLSSWEKSHTDRHRHTSQLNDCMLGRDPVAATVVHSVIWVIF